LFIFILYLYENTHCEMPQGICIMKNKQNAKSQSHF
jgi:hypothetical protein